MKTGRSQLLVTLLATGLIATVFASTAQNDETYIQGAAHVTGNNNTVWRTDLEIRSVGVIGARIRVDLLKKNTDNTNHASFVLELDPGTARRYEDVLDLLFGFSGSATLRITTLDGEIRATSRTFNLTPDGTFGQYIGGTTDDDVFTGGRDATLIQLGASAGDEEGFRTNIGMVNLQGFSTTLDIDLYRAPDEYLGRVSVNLEPYDFKQIDQIFSRVTTEDVADGFAIISARSSNDRYLTYASVIDNLTGDPIFIPGLPNAAGQQSTPTPTNTPTPSLTPTQTQTQTPTPTPTETPPGGPTSTPTITPTRTPFQTVTPTPTPSVAVVVTNLDEETFYLVPSSIRFRVGNGTQTSLVLCSHDGVLSQVAASNFGYIQGPTQTVDWMNCCSDTNFGARLDYRTSLGIGGLAVARSSCTPGTPVFAIIGTDVGSGAQIEIDGTDLDIAIWP